MAQKDAKRMRLATLVGILLWIIGVVPNTAIGQAPPKVVDEHPSANPRTTLGAFRDGFASVSVGPERYYMDMEGEKIRVLGNAVLNDVYSVQQYEREKQQGKSRLLPSKSVLFEKDGKRGVLSPKGEVLVPADYDHIETDYRQFWRLYKGNKKTFYLPDGSILPFYDDLGYLDGEYFDVKQNGGWHLYSKSKGKIVTKDTYERFDFCGGCAVGAAYVHAKKEGKWGIIDWEEKILVPFEYEHAHRSMRNDNWVASFSRNGKPVIVHIRTQQEFDATSSDTQLSAGVLITRENGRFGAYGRDGKPVLPFEYDAISVYGDFFVVNKDGQTHLLRSGQPEPLLALENVEINCVNSRSYSSGRAPLPVFSIKQKAYQGLYFVGNKQFYEPTFYNISLKQNKLAEGGELIEGEKQGIKTLFNMTGEKILPFEVQDYKSFDAKDKILLAFKVKEKWGLYDLEQNKEIVPPKYDQYFKLLDSTLSIIRGFAQGFEGIDLYDFQGNKLNEVELDRIDPIDARYYLLEKNSGGKKEYSILDADRKTIEGLPYPFVAALQGTTELLMVSHNGREGRLYDFKHKKEQERWYKVYMFSAGEDNLEDSEHWLFYGFQNGYAKVQSKDGIGFVDQQGKVLLPPKYTNAMFVGNDHLLVTDGDYILGRPRHYFIDKKGKPVFPKAYFVDDMLYFDINRFHLDGKVVVLRSDRDRDLYFGWGDLKTGKILIPAEYDNISVFDTDATHIMLVKAVADEKGRRSRARANLRYGLADINGRIRFEPQFTAIYNQPQSTYGYFDQKQYTLFPLLVHQGDKWRYLKEDGTYLPLEGDDIDRW